MPQYQVIVGNIGEVHKGEDQREALAVWAEYRKRSRDKIGRAGGEPVTLFKDGEIVPGKDYQPKQQ